MNETTKHLFQREISDAKRRYQERKESLANYVRYTADLERKLTSARHSEVEIAHQTQQAFEAFKELEEDFKQLGGII